MLKRKTVEGGDVNVGLSAGPRRLRTAPFEETRDPRDGFLGAGAVGLAESCAAPPQPFGAPPSTHRERLRMKCTRHRCQALCQDLVGRLLESEVRVRGHQSNATQAPLTSCRRKVSQNSRSYAGPTSVPSTSRSPVVRTPTAITTAIETTRPFSSAFSKVASNIRQD